MTDERHQHELPSSAEEGTPRPTAMAEVVGGRLPRMAETAPHVHNLPHKQPQRRELRNNLTSAEASLWKVACLNTLRQRRERRQPPQLWLKPKHPLLS